MLIAESEDTSKKGVAETQRKSGGLSQCVAGERIELGNHRPNQQSAIRNQQFLLALEGRNEGRPPVWLMRQAGRYLPEYRKLRERHSLKEMFFRPELAARVTKMPVDLLGVDAAILFSDITVVALMLGLQLDFNEGPQIAPWVGPEQVERLPFIGAEEALGAIGQTIEGLKGELTVPLIGFCGGPFTVASYLIEKHTGQELTGTKKWMYRDPESFKRLLDRITEASVDYLRMQERAGVDAVQVFDSWAHVLSDDSFARFCAPYLKRLIEAVKVPVILFMRGACARVKGLVALKPKAISFDWQMEMSELRKQVPKEMAVQGNLDPDLLYAPHDVVRSAARHLVASMKSDRGFIVNLGHGVKPDVPVDAVRCLIDAVKDR